MGVSFTLMRRMLSTLCVNDVDGLQRDPRHTVGSFSLAYFLFAPQVLLLDNMDMNNKLKETIKIFVTYGCLLAPINFVVGSIIGGLNFASGYSLFSITGLIVSFIMGVIGSAIGGLIFYFIYDPVHNWVKGNNFLSKHITDMFTLFWKPFIVGTILSAGFGLLGILGLGAGLAALGGVVGSYVALGFGALFVGWIIMLAVHIVIYYFYAKIITPKLTVLYPW
jgi:hypothetical protein